MMSPFWIIFISFTLFCFLVSVNCQPSELSSTANLSTSWINIGYNPLILARGTSFGLNYACGFYCTGACEKHLFSVFMTDESLFVRRESVFVVWSANRNNLVNENATVELTAEGDLVLRDADGTLAWSTGTAGKGVEGLNLTESGNLVLFDANNSVVWQSFDHPTDCLLQGQTLVSGKSLIASASSNDWSTVGGEYSLSMTQQGLVAYLLSQPPQLYYSKMIGSTKQNISASYAKFQNGSLDLYINGVEPQIADISIPIPGITADSCQYMKLEPDGHLRVFDFGYPLADIFNESLGECDYPMVCGKYGICSHGKCSCPSGTNFSKVNDDSPERECSEVIPPTCNMAARNHSFLDLQDVAYSSFTADIKNTNMKHCKEVCLKNCSCKAVIFRNGDCFLPSEIFSFKRYKKGFTGFNSSVSIKVETASALARPKRKNRLLEPILRSTLGVICVFFVIGTAVFVYEWMRRRKLKRVEENYPNHVPGGMSTRFSFEELATATDNFSKILGKGGFGSVYEGSLNDGTKIAVKHLDGVGHIEKSFIAEVEIFGSIYHTNLVKLIGFCSEKAHRLLVYEYMCNGSLDRWIYCRGHEKCLGWSCRRNIILDIAKGLAYLHEECRQKIMHLDIKPQNILLDEFHNAKLADFGLSKLIDRNQIQVVTNMKGTPGYIAPEFLRAVITERVDVYSFGVVVLEILCGRKIFEESKPEEERYLLTLFKKKAEEKHWLDLVDKCCLDTEFNVAQVEEMMQISAWCIQSDHEKRLFIYLFQYLEIHSYESYLSCHVHYLNLAALIAPNLSVINALFLHFFNYYYYYFKMIENEYRLLCLW